MRILEAAACFAVVLHYTDVFMLLSISPLTEINTVGKKNGNCCPHNAAEFNSNKPQPPK